MHAREREREPPQPVVLLPVLRHHLRIVERLRQEDKEPAKVYQGGGNYKQDLCQVRNALRTCCSVTISWPRFNPVFTIPELKLKIKESVKR